MGKAAIAAKKQAVRFTETGKNTINDANTGLEWIQDPDKVPGFDKEMTQAEAIEACKNLDYAGHKDWYLPERPELDSIVDLTRYNPAINPIFKAHGSWYWTRTPLAGDSSYAWIVDFGNGSVYDDGKGNRVCVRPVRRSSQ